MSLATESLQLFSAYAAGFFDGEGTVTFIKKKNSYGLRVSVYNTDRSILEDFERHFGGRVQPREDRRGSGPPVYIWTANSDALDFLRTIRPYMREKTKCARTDLILEEYAPIKGQNRNGRNVKISQKLHDIAERVRNLVTK